MILYIIELTKGLILILKYFKFTCINNIHVQLWPVEKVNIQNCQHEKVISMRAHPEVK